MKICFLSSRSPSSGGFQTRFATLRLAVYPEPVRWEVQQSFVCQIFFSPGLKFHIHFSTLEFIKAGPSTHFIFLVFIYKKRQLFEVYVSKMLFEIDVAQQSHDTADIVNSVTPQRQSLVIPYHLQEIKKWLKPDASGSNRRSRRNRINENNKTVELCEKRLNASLLMSQYDCI